MGVWRVCATWLPDGVGGLSVGGGWWGLLPGGLMRRSRGWRIIHRVVAVVNVLAIVIVLGVVVLHNNATLV